MPLASIIGVCLLAGLKPALMCQTPGAKTTRASQGVLPEYIQEFFLSEAVRSQEQGEVQLTVGGMGFRNHKSAADGESSGLDSEYGITRRLQLAMELPYGIQSTAASELPVGWSTMSASLLYQFVRSNHPFALSAAMGVNLPLTSRGATSFEPELLAAKQFGTLQIHVSFIPELNKDDNSLAYNVAAVRPCAHDLRPTLEFSGRRNAGVNSFYVTPGTYKHLPHRLEIGAGVPIGASSHSSPVGIVVKITWEFGGDDTD
ncbi:MAG: hypothetical protein ABSC47_09790 [Terracidiphilus sp.]|jgi:hypothetical protein